MSKERDMLESSVEAYLRKQVSLRGGECVKFIPDLKRGFPDRIVILPHGALAWVETKRPVGGVLDGAQKIAHILLRRLGQLVFICYTKDQVDSLLLELGF